MAEPTGDGVRTVLHVQQFGDGGAVTSLLGLVRGLDPSRYRSVVAFRTPNRFLDDFRDAGASVVVLDGSASPTASPTTAPTAPPSAPAGGPTDGVARRADGAPVERAAPWRRELRRLVRRDLPAARRLGQVIAEHRPDLVHPANEVLSNRYAIAAARRARVPVVQHLRGSHRYERGVDLSVDGRLARQVARAIAISHAVADETARELPALAGRIDVIDNPFDLSAFPGDGPGDLAEELGLRADAEVVVLLGRIAWWKGQDVLLRAVADLRVRRPDLVALVVGAASTTYGDAYEASLHRLAAELGVEDRVVFTGDRRDVPQVLALADVVVHCSTEPEPFGRVVVEAMAAERPVVASRAGGVLEIVDDGTTGVLVDPGDPGALAAAIERLLDDRAEAGRMATAARVAVTGRFSLAAHARAVEAVYDRVLGAARPPR